MTETVLAHTESVCPQCLRRLPATRVAENDNVYLVKACPEHGAFRTVIWRGLDNYVAWGARPGAAAPPRGAGPRLEGCPFDCGLCAEHRQHSCCVLVEVTERCNLRCPVCFASAGGTRGDPSQAAIRDWLTALYATSPDVNLQLSGGEPTVRDDLPEIIAMAREIGFDFVQLNTNGIRLSRDPAYARRLALAGLDCVFLQFDALDDQRYRVIRGIDLLDAKLAAIDHCRRARLGVVLVPTLVPGVNTQAIGALVDFAARHTPTVRAIHFQPVSYFGRYPRAPDDADRITLPEVMRAIVAHGGGTLNAADFHPGAAENPYCSFSGSFYVDADNRLHAAGTDQACGCGSAPTRAAPRDETQHARQTVARKWAAPAQEAAPSCCPGVSVLSLDAFLAQRRRSLSISAMAFQDAWTLDLARLRDCYIHVAHPDHRVIPFCAYNLTAQSGRSLYRAD
ncbi:MAG: radical SAM protein [Paludibacterium sp.]|uniref:radical SAM (seleno)protein TrsS n=1 Tax=Paludibacterium sp. TaxID=1917523 RepID=UPI0025DCB7E0|nr:radical SAM (seleno)protein TrsS [Paludibacterium sp.]MBV8047199.1 radical SAM protein [Paludibacterium sp.]